MALVDPLNSMPNVVSDLSASTSVTSTSIRLNAFLPVSRLPPETLYRIFSYVTAHAKEDNYKFLLVLAEVCFQWWRLIEDSPTCWTVLSSRNHPALTLHALAKSRVTPLEIRLYPGAHHRLFDFWATILPIVSRWRVAWFLVDSIDAFMVPIINEANAPWLEDLVLSSRWSLNPSVVLSKLFNNHTPVLARLRLLAVILPWKDCAIPSLRVLNIRNITHGAPSLQELINALLSMPNLEELMLNDVHVLKLDYDHPSPFLLRFLQKLSLTVPGEAIDRLLPLIDAPQIRYLSLHHMKFQTSPYRSTTFDSCPPVISAICNKLANKQRRMRIKFEGQYQRLSYEYLTNRGKPIICLSAHFTSIFGFIRNELQGRPLSIIAKRLQGNPLDAFFETLATITDIEKILLDSPGDMGPFLQLLGHPVGQDGLETAKGPFWKLKSLVIRNSSISAIDLLLALQKRYTGEKPTTGPSTDVPPSLKLELTGVQRLSYRILAKMEKFLGPGQIIWREDTIHPDETDGWSEQCDCATEEEQGSNDSQRRSEDDGERIIYHTMG